MLKGHKSSKQANLVLIQLKLIMLKGRKSSNNPAKEFISKQYPQFLSASWLVGCVEDLRRFSDISAMLQLGSRR